MHPHQHTSRELRERREAVIGKEVCGSVSCTRTLSQHVQRSINWGSVGTVELSDLEGLDTYPTHG